VLDILLIDAIGEIDYRKAGNAARRVFDERGTHAFPPTFVMPTAWGPELEALASELEFYVTTSEAIERRFREVIELLAGAQVER
jgi:hypothetical protein